MDQVINLEVISPNEFKGQVRLVLQPAAEQPGLTAPGKEAGDVRLTEAGGENKPATAVVSLGPQVKIDGEAYRRAGAGVAHWLANNRVSEAGLDLSGILGLDLASGTGALSEGLLLGAFRFDRYKTSTEQPVKTRLSLIASDGANGEAGR